MDRHADAARLLLSARRDPAQRLHALPEVLRPDGAEAAYLVQRAVMAGLGEVGGWKVGFSPELGAFSCAPLPRTGVLPSPASVDASCTGPAYKEWGIEAEVAVTLAADLPHRDAPYGEADLRAAIESAHPAIEVLQSRFVDPEAVDKPSLLADSLSHHALVVGPAMAYWDGVDLRHETVRVVVSGQEVKTATGNPAGAMLPLLVWLANTGAAWAGGLRAGQVVTTGSWTGADPVPAGGTGRVVFAHMGAAEVSFP